MSHTSQQQDILVRDQETSSGQKRKSYLLLYIRKRTQDLGGSQVRTLRTLVNTQLREMVHTVELEKLQQESEEEKSVGSGPRLESTKPEASRYLKSAE